MLCIFNNVNCKSSSDKMLGMSYYNKQKRKFIITVTVHVHKIVGRITFNVYV